MSARLRRFEIERQLIGAVNSSVEESYPLEGLTSQAVDFWIRRNELQGPESKHIRDAVLELSRRIGSIFGESGQEIVAKVDELGAEIVSVTDEFRRKITR